MSINLLRQHARLAHAASATTALLGLALLGCSPTATSSDGQPPNTSVPAPTASPPTPTSAVVDHRNPLDAIDAFLGAISTDGPKPSLGRVVTPDLEARFDARSLVPAEWPAGHVEFTTASSPQITCTTDHCHIATLIHTALLNTTGDTLADAGYRSYRFALTRQPDGSWLIATITTASLP